MESGEQCEKKKVDCLTIGLRGGKILALFISGGTVYGLVFSTDNSNINST